ncbi:MAG: radical SAM protein [Azospirillum sp.]|nr:radical SAM protein [Azospirillum sp.]
MRRDLDLLLINPGGRDRVYQELGSGLTAVEPPLWCRLIGGYARDRGFSIAIIDSEAEQWGPRQVAERVRDLAPRLVAVVVFGHQPSASTQQMVAAGETCRSIKALEPGLKIILIGGHVSALPERTLREEVAADFVCKGEGPVTVVQLLDVLRRAPAPADLPCETGGPSPFEAVEGLVWRQQGAVRVNPPPALIQDLDRNLHGNVWDLLPMDRYRAHNWQCFHDLNTRQPYASIYTSLGCPFHCSFCCINAPFESNRYRLRSPEATVAEIEHLYRVYGVRTFKIIDEMFVLKERHVESICDRLIALDLNDLNIWAYARVDTVRPAMLGKLRAAGFRWLALGIESASDQVREGARKSMRQADIVSTVRAIQGAGIAVIGNYIFGLPDDDLNSMQETLALAKALNCEFANFYAAMAYPGSVLYDTAVAKGWPLPESWSGFSQHSYDCRPLPSGKVDSATVLKFRDDAFHEYFQNPHYLEMVTRRFGRDTRVHIAEMSETRLRRRLLEDPRGQK